MASILLTQLISFIEIQITHSQNNMLKKNMKKKIIMTRKKIIMMKKSIMMSMKGIRKDQLRLPMTLLKQDLFLIFLMIFTLKKSHSTS